MVELMQVTACISRQSTTCATFQATEPVLTGKGDQGISTTVLLVMRPSDCIPCCGTPTRRLQGLLIVSNQEERHSRAANSQIEGGRKAVVVPPTEEVMLTKLPAATIKTIVV